MNSELLLKVLIFFTLVSGYGVVGYSTVFGVVDSHFVFHHLSQRDWSPWSFYPASLYGA